MKQNHFMIPYFGNKRKEVELIYNEIKDKINDIEFIVEPFCGSCALSYYISLKHPNKYTYILNDNNHQLIELINISKDEAKMSKFKDDLLKIYDNVYNDKKKYLEVVKKAKEGDYISFVFINKYYQIRPGIFPTEDRRSKSSLENIDKCNFLNFIRTEKTLTSNKDAVEIYDLYKNNNNTLIFLDPPYLQTCNDFYLDSSINIYEYLFYNNIKKEKALICLCINDIWITKLLFKDIINTKSYDKTYEANGKKGEGKKKASHIIILNK